MAGPNADTCFCRSGSLALGGTRLGGSCARAAARQSSPSPSRKSIAALYRWVRAVDDPVLPPLRKVARELELIRPQLFSPPSPEASSIALFTWTNRHVSSEHLPRNLAYCQRHGYTCVHENTRRLPWLKMHFEKLAMVERALDRFKAVLLIDDDASVHRPELPLQSFLDMFSTSSIIASSHSWAYPIVHRGKALVKQTWNVPHTENPMQPHWVWPHAFLLNTGVMIYRNSTYTRTLLRLLLANNATACTKYDNGGAFEQDAINAALSTSWMNHVGLLPAHAWNCHPGKLNTYGRCLNPFVLHIAGRKNKSLVGPRKDQMRQLLHQATPPSRGSQFYDGIRLQ